MKPIHKPLVVTMLIVGTICFTGCKKTNTAEDGSDDSTNVKPKTEVEVACPTDTVNLSNEITLNATAQFLLKTDVKATATGYITQMHIKPGDKVSEGQVLFALQTKEAHALGNTVNQLDANLHFSGKATVISPATGYVVMLNHQSGDYVQDGETLATVADANNFGFVMDVPYELSQLIVMHKEYQIALPDGRTIKGRVSRIMPTVNASAQTQQVFLKVGHEKNVPENLIATIRLVRSHAHGLCVPKEAVLTNDVQSKFWVMKVINDSTAVKMMIRKGIETNDRVQIDSGALKISDRILISGNYGMPDTTAIKIIR